MLGHSLTKLRAMFIALMSNFGSGVETDFEVWAGGYNEGVQAIATLLELDGDTITITELQTLKDTVRNSGMSKDESKTFHASRYVLYEVYLDWLTEVQIKHSGHDEEDTRGRRNMLNDVKHTVEVKRQKEREAN